VILKQSLVFSFYNWVVQSEWDSWQIETCLGSWTALLGTQGHNYLITPTTGQSKAVSQLSFIANIESYFSKTY
jgi:hypothetical protein